MMEQRCCAFAHGRGMRMVLLLFLAHVLAPVAAQQELLTVLRGSGPNETASLMLKVLQTVQDRAGKPTDLIYRALPLPTSVSTASGTATAQTDFINNPAKVDFALGSQPLSNSQWSGLGSGAVMQIPIGMFTVSLYYNIPGAPTAPLNLTACMLQKLLTTQAVAWNPTITARNPALSIADTSIKVTVFVEALLAPSTQLLLTYLASTSCPVAAGTSLAATYSADVGLSVMKTSYSIGCMLTSRGSALGLKEAAIQNANLDYVTSTTFNLTSTQASVRAVLPSSPTADFSAVVTSNRAGAMVYPILAVSYMYLLTNQAATGDKGALLQALAQFTLSTEAQSYCVGAGLLPIGSTATLLSSVSTGITLQAGTQPYTIETLGTISLTGQDTHSISATRVNYNRVIIEDLKAQVAALSAQFAQSCPRLLRGSGSSAVSLVVWRALDTMAAEATTPIWTSYRAIGSGGGESEVVGNPAGAAAAVDFGCSDVPMTKTSYNALASAGIKVVHIPMHIAPISIFVNIPTSILPKQQLKLSPCTIAGIFQGSIATWDDAAIAADNAGSGITLPALKILPAYRSSSSGTNAVFSQYFATACPSGWKLGSGKSLPVPGAAGTFSVNAVGVGSSSDMTTYIKNNGMSIGYADSGNGIAIGLMEASLRNKNGNWLTAQTADLSAAASQLFQAGGWPSDPTADFSGVSLLDQPGDRTWPVTSMPFVMLRLDVTTRGNSGALLSAFLNYLLSPTAQALLPVMGFSPVSSDVLQYTLQRALPLLSIDTRVPTWFTETSSGTKFTGAGDSVLSAAKSTYVFTAAVQYMTNTLSSSSTAASASNSTFNASSLDLSTIAGLSGISGELDDTNKKLTSLTIVATAALIFGFAALSASLFAAYKLFVVGLNSRNQVNSSGAGTIKEGAGRGSMSGLSGRGSNCGIDADLTVRGVKSGPL